MNLNGAQKAFIKRQLMAIEELDTLATGLSIERQRRVDLHQRLYQKASRAEAELRNSAGGLHFLGSEQYARDQLAHLREAADVARTEYEGMRADLEAITARAGAVARDRSALERLTRRLLKRCGLDEGLIDDHTRFAVAGASAGVHGILREGSPARKELDELEQDMARVRAQSLLVSTARLPLEEVRRRLLDAVKGRLGYVGCIAGELGSFENPDPRAARLPAEPMSFLDICWLFGPERVVDLAVEQLNVPGRQSGLTADERAARLSALEAELLTLQRRAAREALKLEAAGYTVLRDEHADVDVLLEALAESPRARPASLAQ